MAGWHYISKYLVKHFRGDPNLFEWDKATEKAVPRTPSDAGAEVGIWPEEIERQQMQQWDNPAHKVLQAKVNKPGLTTIELSGKEREILNEWFFIHIFRSPVHRQRCINLDNAGLRTLTHSQYLERDRLELITNRGQFIAMVESSEPVKFAERVKQFGRVAVENAVMDHFREKIESGAYSNASDSVDLYHHTLQSGQYRNHIGNVSDMKWTWLRSAQDFVIGDNPYDRCDSWTGEFNCGLEKPHLEVFFPLGRHLCLWMHRRKRNAAEILITEAQTKEINLRQLRNCVAKAWGSSDDIFSTEGSSSGKSPIP